MTRRGGHDVQDGDLVPLNHVQEPLKGELGYDVYGALELGGHEDHEELPVGVVERQKADPPLACP